MSAESAGGRLIMQLGRTLIGAVVGAALGIGLLFAVNFLFRVDHIAMAIAVAILTGLGVRTLVSTAGHASYARGALTGILALAAYVGGWFLVAEVAKATSKGAARPARVAARQVAEKDTAEAAPAEGDAAVVEPERSLERPQNGPVMPKSAPLGQDPWSYVWLGIAALVAYELGRGTGAKPVEVAASEPAGEDRPADA